ncbi:hypothetical protein V6Z12_D06G058200 [Gossypium hirsutum]
MSYFFFFCKTFFNIFPLHIPSKEKPSFPSLSPFFAIPTQCLVLANNASQYLSPTFIFDLPLFDDDVHLPVSKFSRWSFTSFTHQQLTLFPCLFYRQSHQLELRKVNFCWLI